MPVTKEIELFTYDELSDSAKETARQWWLECRDSSDFDYVVEDFKAIAEMMGFQFKTHPVRLMSGKERMDANIWWSVGYCQSDFAAFEGSYRYAKGFANKVQAYAPKDETLHSICDALLVLQKGAGYRLNYGITYSDYYGVAVEPDLYGKETSYEQDKEFREIVKSLNRWLYDRLREEDEYQTSEEAIAEAMEANEYTFREDGRRED